MELSHVLRQLFSQSISKAASQSVSQ